MLRDDDLAVCPKSGASGLVNRTHIARVRHGRQIDRLSGLTQSLGDIIEDLPSWLLDWRQHLLQRQQCRGERGCLCARGCLFGAAAGKLGFWIEAPVLPNNSCPQVTGSEGAVALLSD